jgi:hypothetical protein
VLSDTDQGYTFQVLQGELKARLDKPSGLPASSVTNYLSELMAEMLVEKEGSFYRLTPLGRKVLALLVAVSDQISKDVKTDEMKSVIVKFLDMKVPEEKIRAALNTIAGDEFSAEELQALYEEVITRGPLAAEPTIGRGLPSTKGIAEPVPVSSGRGRSARRAE